MLATTLLGWCLVRPVLNRRSKALLAAGVVGLGCEFKPQVALVAIVLMVVLAILGPRAPLRSRWFGAGVVAALVLAGPYIIWQAMHSWPQLTVAGNVGGSAEGGRAGFIPFQLLLVSPVLAPVWIAGLAAPFRRAALRPLRFVTIGYVVLLVLYIVGNGKAYYLGSLYPALLGLGAVPTADRLTRATSPWRMRTFAAAVTLSAVVAALIGLPLLPSSTLPHSPVLAVNPDQGETVGWPAFIADVRRAWASLVDERTHAVIFTSNYGEAGAIDLLGGNLPRAYSGHNAYSDWGRPPDSATFALVVGEASRTAAEFRDCRLRTRIDNGLGLDNQEQGEPVMLCRPLSPWPTLWPQLRHYD